MKVLFFIGAIINIIFCALNLSIIVVEMVDQSDSITKKEHNIFKGIIWLLAIIFAFNAVICLVGHNIC